MLTIARDAVLGHEMGWRPEVPLPLCHFLVSGYGVYPGPHLLNLTATFWRWLSCSAHACLFVYSFSPRINFQEALILENKTFQWTVNEALPDFTVSVWWKKKSLKIAVLWQWIVFERPNVVWVNLKNTPPHFLGKVFLPCLDPSFSEAFILGKVFHDLYHADTLV